MNASFKKALHNFDFVFVLDVVFDLGSNNANVDTSDGVNNDA